MTLLLGSTLSTMLKTGLLTIGRSEQASARETEGKSMAFSLGFWYCSDVENLKNVILSKTKNLKKRHDMVYFLQWPDPSATPQDDKTK
jgi:hypothetical protein